MKPSGDNSGVKISIHHAKIISPIDLLWPSYLSVLAANSM